MSIFFTTLFCGAFVVIVIFYLRFLYSRRNLYKCASMLPGPLSLPFIGSAYLYFIDPWKAILYTCNNFNEDGLNKIWVGPFLSISIMNPEWLKIVLNNSLEKDERVYGAFKTVFGNSLPIAPVSIWKPRRKLISPVFKKKNLDGFVEIFVKCSENLLQELSSKIGNEEFDIGPYILNCTLHMICETMMGIEFNTINNKNSEIFNSIESEQEIMIKRISNPLFGFQFLFNLTKYAKIEKGNMNVFKKFAQNIIEKKKSELKNEYNQSEFEEDHRKQKTFLEMMIDFTDNENKLSAEDVTSEVLVLIAAGNDTSGISSSFILMVLGQHPEIQNKIFQELNDIFGDSKRPITHEDLPKMLYLERVIMEAIRLFPAIPFIFRRATQDIHLGKYVIPEGCTLHIPIFKLHRDKKIWGNNAEEFDPDRFLPENSINRHPSSFLAFSSGMRNCIGKQYGMMAVKTIVATVLRAYKIISTVDYKNIPLRLEVMLKPKYGYMISIESRANAE